MRIRLTNINKRYTTEKIRVRSTTAPVCSTMETDLMKANFIDGNRGSINLLDSNNYTYIRRKKLSESVTLWKCSQFRESCPALAKTVDHEDGEVYYLQIPDISKHTCTVNIDKVVAVAAREEAKKKAVENKTVKPRKIFADMTAQMATNGVTMAPVTSLDTFRKAINRKRKAEGGNFNIPKTFRELAEMFPDEMKVTEDDKSFLVYAGNTKGTKIEDMNNLEKTHDPIVLIFISKIGREILRSGYIWFGDGTFKSCPRPFSQIYTVFGQRKGFKSLPAAFTLLPNKEEATYQQMWKVKT